MKTLLYCIILISLASCDVAKRHQRLIRKNPELIQTIEKTDTVNVTITKQIECPDGSIIEVQCDTVVIYRTNTIQLPPTNAQIRQIERTKRKEIDVLRRMYEDSLSHERAVKRIEKRIQKNDNKTAVKVANVKQKDKRNPWMWAAFIAFSLLGIRFMSLIWQYWRNRQG